MKGPGLPTPGTSKIALKGTLVFSCGGGEADEQKDVPLEDGTKFNAGPVPMTVILGKNPGAGNLASPPTGRPERLGIHAPHRDAAHRNQIRRVPRRHGKEIPIRASMSWSLNPGEATATETSYTLDRKVNKVTVKVRHVDHLETLSVPVDTTVGVGF